MVSNGNISNNPNLQPAVNAPSNAPEKNTEKPEAKKTKDLGVDNFKASKGTDIETQRFSLTGYSRSAMETDFSGPGGLNYLGETREIYETRVKEEREAKRERDIQMIALSSSSSSTLKSLFENSGLAQETIDKLLKQVESAADSELSSLTLEQLVSLQTGGKVDVNNLISERKAALKFLGLENSPGADKYTGQQLLEMLKDKSETESLLGNMTHKPPELNTTQKPAEAKKEALTAKAREDYEKALDKQKLFKGVADMSGKQILSTKLGDRFNNAA